MHSICKKISITFVFFSLEILVLKCEEIGYAKPPVCTIVECPGYGVVHSQKDFEIRSYQPVNWISFAVNSSDYEFARRNAFQRLFEYTFNGKNKDKVRMNATAPTMIDVGFVTNSSLYKMYYYVPKRFQSNPPAPISSDDQIVKLPETKFAAVRRFDAGDQQVVIEKEAKNLKDSLKGTQWESVASIAAYSFADFSAPILPKWLFEIVIWFN